MALKPQELSPDTLNYIDLYNIRRWEQYIDSELSQLRLWEDRNEDEQLEDDDLSDTSDEEIYIGRTDLGLFLYYGSSIKPNKHEYPVFLPTTIEAQRDYGIPQLEGRYLGELIRRYRNVGWEKVEFEIKTKQEAETGGKEWTGYFLVFTSPPPSLLKATPEKPKPKNPRRGFVYLFKAENGLCKIGRSKNPEQRMRKMTSAIIPFQIEMLHTIACKDAVAAEGYLHKIYSNKRVIGEWFKLSEDDVSQILSIQMM